MKQQPRHTSHPNLRSIIACSVVSSTAAAARGAAAEVALQLRELVGRHHDDLVAARIGCHGQADCTRCTCTINISKDMFRFESQRNELIAEPRSRDRPRSERPEPPPSYPPRSY